MTNLWKAVKRKNKIIVIIYKVRNMADPNKWVDTKRYIVTYLGFPVVRVELTETMLEVAIDEAITRWTEFRTDRSMGALINDFHIISLTPGVPNYPILELIPQLATTDDVLSVTYDPQNYDLFNVAFTTQFDFLFFLTADELPDLSTFYMIQMKQELVNEVLGQNGHWEIVNNELYLWPTPGLGSIKGEGPSTTATISQVGSSGSGNFAGVFYRRIGDIETLAKVSWVRRYALNESRYMLARIRGKYMNVLGPNGEIQLDAAELKAEYEQMHERLLQELYTQSAPLAITQTFS